MKQQAYKSLVRPTMEYASSVWDPTTQEDRYKIEMVQRRAARYVLGRHHNRSSVTNMIEHLNWRTLEERRRQARLVMMFKMSHNLVNVDTAANLKTPARRTRHMHDYYYTQQRCSTEARRLSFFPRTVRDWNALPAATVSAESLDQFKALLTV